MAEYARTYFYRSCGLRFNKLDMTTWSNASLGIYIKQWNDKQNEPTVQWCPAKFDITGEIQI